MIVLPSSSLKVWAANSNERRAVIELPVVEKVSEIDLRLEGELRLFYDLERRAWLLGEAG